MTTSSFWVTRRARVVSLTTRWCRTNSKQGYSIKKDATTYITQSETTKHTILNHLFPIQTGIGIPNGTEKIINQVSTSQLWLYQKERPRTQAECCLKSQEIGCDGAIVICLAYKSAE